MAERSHLSIGEVLSLLRDEFPDVTISKIRFLESQGLVDPERTPSGYRKFYDHDVERLRWILRQQREHFLPLKVIRGRLTEHEGAEPTDGPMTPEEAERGKEEDEAPAAPAAPAGAAPSAAAQRAPAGVATASEAARREPAPRETAHREAAQHEPAHREPAGERPAPAPAPTSGPEPPRANGPARPAPPTPSLFAALHAEQAQPEVPAPAAAAAFHGEEADTYTAEEMAAAVGAEPTMVQELKQYGLISPHAVVAGIAYYDASALAVTRCAAEFAHHGVEARHLRTWRNAADREADLFQQVVLPLLRQRNPQARRQAMETLAELCAAGAALRAALVERAVREIH